MRGRRFSGKTLAAWPILYLVTLTFAVAMGFPGGIGPAGAAETEVDEFARVRLTSTDPMRRFRVDVELRLQIGDHSGSSFEASTRVKDDGLEGNRLFDMVIASTGPDQEYDSILIDVGLAKEECDEDPDDREEIDCEWVLELRGSLAQAPFNIPTLEGLSINIGEQLIGREGPRLEMLTGTVTESDIVNMNR